MRLAKIRPLGFALFIADTQTRQSQESLSSMVLCKNLLILSGKTLSIQLLQIRVF